MSAFTIRFQGLCCHVSKGATRRTILPNAESPHAHFAYIEFFADELEFASQGLRVIDYTGGPENVAYRRVDIKNMQVELENITSPALQVTKSYEERIPKLQELVPSWPGLKPEFSASPIPSGKVAAYFDMTKGVLSGGPPENKVTEFERSGVKPRRVARWAQLDVELEEGPIVFKLTDLSPDAGTKKVKELRLRPDCDLVTIGNQTLEDILRMPGPRLSGHFQVYYEMADPPFESIKNLPRPVPGLGLGTGCSNSNFP